MMGALLSPEPSQEYARDGARCPKDPGRRRSDVSVHPEIARPFSAGRIDRALFLALVAVSGCSLGPVRFGNPYALPLLLLVPLAVWLYRRRRPMTAVFGAGAILAKAGRGWVGRFHWLPALLRVLGISFLLLGATRPQLRAPELAAKEGIDIIIALDLSGSMSRSLSGRRPTYNSPARLEVAKKLLVEEILQTRPNDRIGLVIFGAEAYSRAPLTLDHEILARMVKDLSGNLFEQDFSSQTAIGEALGVSINRLTRAESRTKAIILLTDGVSNAGLVTPEDAAATAAKKGVRIYPILIGREGSEEVDAKQLDVIADTTGTGEEIARSQESGQHHYGAANEELFVKSLEGVLDSLDRAVIQAAGRESFQEVGPWLAVFAALLLALEALLRLWRFRGLP